MSRFVKGGRENNGGNKPRKAERKRPVPLPCRKDDGANLSRNKEQEKKGSV